MTSAKPGLKALIEMIGVTPVPVLLVALVDPGPAAAQSNTKFGIGALAHNMTGTDNSVFGFDALFSNTIGSDNTASGVNALESNTTGIDNAAVV